MRLSRIASILGVLLTTVMLTACTEQPPNDDVPYPGTITKKIFSQGYTTMIPISLGNGITTYMIDSVPDRYELAIRYCQPGGGEPCESTTRELYESDWDHFTDGQKIIYLNGRIYAYDDPRITSSVTTSPTTTS